MSGVWIGLIIGAVIIGIPSARYQRTKRARGDWVGARSAHHNARRTFWRELGGLLGAAAAIPLVLAVLYLIGRRYR